MGMKLRCVWLVLTLAAAPLSAGVAASIYITDSVSVALFPDQGLSGEPIQRLLSGTAVEVLESRGEFTQIRTGSGNIGWVRSSFLTANVPAIIQLDEVVALVDELQDELALSRQSVDALQDELAASKRRLATLQKSADAGKDVGWLKGELKKSREAAAQAQESLAQKLSELEALQQQLTETQAQLQELKSANDDLYQKLAASELILTDAAADGGPTEPQEGGGYGVLLWSAVAVLLALGAGFVAGYRWLDRKVVRHFGGIRLY